MESPSRVQWAEVTSDEQIAALMGDELRAHEKLEDRLLPVDHALSRRAQFWLDEMDARLRAEYVDDMARVPRPRALVWNTPDPNAYSLMTSLCVDAPVRIDSPSYPDPKAGASGPVRLTFLKNSVAFDPTPCQFPEKDLSPEEIVDHFGSRIPGCALSWTNGEFVFSGAECGKGLSAATEIRGLRWLAVTNLIVLNSSLFAATSTESSVVMILGHELGHFYRAHGFHMDPGFFYELQPGGIAHLPDAVKDNARLLRAHERSTLAFPPALAPAAGVPAELQTWMMTTVGPFLRLAPKCAAASAVYASPEFDSRVFRPWLDSMTAGGDGALDPAGRALYLEFESLALACAQETTVAAEWVSSLNSASPAHELRFSAKTGEKLSRTIERLSAAVTKRKAEAEAFRAELSDRRLGWYTPEQEADDVMTELSALIGLSAEETVRAAFDFFRLLEKFVVEAGYADGIEGPMMDECEQMQRQGWPDASRFEVAFSDDTHHGGCFRIFNLDQEYGAHAYEAGHDRVAPPEGSPSFTEIQRIARELPLPPSSPEDGDRKPSPRHSVLRHL